MEDKKEKETSRQESRARQECQEAAMRYEKACSDHRGAKETIRMAEQKAEQNPGSFQFDAAWQEMLNHADMKLLEADKIRHKSEKDHKQAALAYRELEERATRLAKQLKRVVNKARPYYQQKTSYLEFLEGQKRRVMELESSYEKAKKTYAGALTNLEKISEEIHRQRGEAMKKSTIPNEPRQECIGAEAPAIDDETIRKTESLSRKEAKLLRLLTKKKKPFTRKTLRNSLCLDLGIGTEFDVGNVLESPQSPGAQSVDLGAVLSKSFEDYEILEIDSLEKPHRLRRQLSTLSHDDNVFL